MGCLFTLAKWYIKLCILITALYFLAKITQAMPFILMIALGYYVYTVYGMPIREKYRQRRQCKANGGKVYAWNRKTNKDELVPAPKYLGGQDWHEQQLFIYHARDNFNAWTKLLFWFCVACGLACIYGVYICKHGYMWDEIKDVYGYKKEYTDAGRELMGKRRDFYIALDEKTHLASVDEKISFFVVKNRRTPAWQTLYYLMGSNLGERAALTLRDSRWNALSKRGAIDEIHSEKVKQTKWEYFWDIKPEFYEAPAQEL